RQVVTELGRQQPAKVVAEFSRILEKDLPNLALPWRHDVPRASYLNKALLRVYEARPRDFVGVLGIEGVGPKTIRALAMVAEVAYGAAASFRDPVRYSFSHGGKDGHPYPVDRQVYDRSIAVLEQALAAAKIGRTDRMQALRRLGSFARVEAR
ncbi:MAG: uncharacterized protein PWQ18_1302, partial [Clostridia bacterium]|nr:uncharacterized protein [Clostridia bacterium]